MHIPNLSEESIRRTIPYIQDLGPPTRGGQKLVYPCTIERKRYALKFMLTNPSVPPDTTHDSSLDIFDEITARARREVEIMSQCDTPHIVKVGPIPLTAAEINGQRVIYFAEEWIDGKDVHRIIEEVGQLPIAEVIRLGMHITEAVKIIWSMAKIHRDIKPGNIMRRDSSGDYVLLDMGLAFDLEDVSLTSYGVIVGTPFYLSPEQTEFTRKRQMDFRSDLFSLGIVLYEAATGSHPFCRPGMGSYEAVACILGATPTPAKSLRTDIPSELDSIIMRLLAKRPHLRYRTCDQLQTDLRGIQSRMVRS